jgi:hypothetical protein
MYGGEWGNTLRDGREKRRVRVEAEGGKLQREEEEGESLVS